MVHRLRRAEFGDRRQYAEGVAGEENDVGRLAGLARDTRVADVFDRVAGAGVAGQRGVVVLYFVVFVVGDVFQHGAEFDGAEDFRLFFCGEVDDFGVAAAFDVEDAVFSPDVFVVADEVAVRVGRECGFAGAGEAKQHGRALAALFCGSGAVHGELALFRHEVVHDGEHAFFHFARVFGAEDDHVFVFKGERDGGGAGNAFDGAVGRAVAGVIDDVIRLAEARQLGVGRADEHVVHEQRVVRTGGDDAHFQAVFFVPTGVAVQHVNVFRFIEVAHGQIAVGLVRGGGERDIDFAPPDVVFGSGVLDDAFVFR